MRAVVYDYLSSAHIVHEMTQRVGAMDDITLDVLADIDNQQVLRRDDQGTVGSALWLLCRVFGIVVIGARYELKGVANGSSFLDDCRHGEIFA